MDSYRDERFVSRPHRIVFAGWETTTTRLQQGGWSLAAEQDISSRRLRLALRFEPARLYMLSEAITHDFMSARDETLTFQVRYVVGSDIVINDSGDWGQWSAIDAVPQFVQSRRSLEDFRIFAVPLTRTEEIIVEPATVAALLDKIKALQSPELAAIRARQRENAASPGSTRYGRVVPTNFHAQLVSLAA